MAIKEWSEKDLAMFYLRAFNPSERNAALQDRAASLETVRRYLPETAKYIEYLQNLSEELFEYEFYLDDINQSIEDFYGDALDELNEKLDKYEFEKVINLVPKPVRISTLPEYE